MVERAALRPNDPRSDYELYVQFVTSDTVEGAVASEGDGRGRESKGSYHGSQILSCRVEDVENLILILLGGDTLNPEMILIVQEKGTSSGFTVRYSR